ncbi:MAG: hypothetical protein AAFZ91_06410 [Pseudomonadota bacterium]
MLKVWLRTVLIVASAGVIVLSSNTSQSTAQQTAPVEAQPDRADKIVLRGAMRPVEYNQKHTATFAKNTTIEISLKDYGVGSNIPSKLDYISINGSTLSSDIKGYPTVLKAVNETTLKTIERIFCIKDTENTCSEIRVTFLAVYLDPSRHTDDDATCILKMATDMSFVAGECRPID